MAVLYVTADTTRIALGRQGENCATRVRFDLSAWQAQYGAGTPKLIHKRSLDDTPYPVELSTKGKYAYWTVTSADTAYAGRGKCELSYYSGDVVVKAAAYQTDVQPSMGDEFCEPPEDVTSWVDTLNRAIIQANEAVEAANEAAEAANKAAEEASNAAGGSAEGVLTVSDVATNEEAEENLNDVFGE